MSSTEDVEIKAGHPPALKVGGVRIPQRVREEKEAVPVKVRKDSDKEDEDNGTIPIVSKSPPKAPVLVSGIVGKPEKDFPTEAVKHTHEKPVPTHENRSTHITKPAVIMQPRK